METFLVKYHLEKTEYMGEGSKKISDYVLVEATDEDDAEAKVREKFQSKPEDRYGEYTSVIGVIVKQKIK